MEPRPETNLEDWSRVPGVDATGQFLGMRQAVPVMAKQGVGPVINSSSDAGFIGAACCCAYGATKGAVRLLTKYIEVEFATQDARVNSIHSAWFDIGM